MNNIQLLKNDYYSFKNFISNIWGNKKPLCKLFSTDGNDYLYDTGTNKILKCEKKEFELFGYLLNLDFEGAIERFLSTNSKLDANRSIMSIEKFIREENILRLTEIKDFGLSHEYDSVIDKINNELGIIQLELTQDCNLRCRYCIYNKNYKEKRNHRNYYMTEQVARKSIEYLKKHSSKRDSVCVVFYGGEPLLNFDLLENTVLYAKKQLINKELRFSLTTNGTLINDVIADYLYKENFGVLLSLDGPKEIHDSWRTDIINGGSFDHTYRGLK